ncbi:hypothetical protein [Endozoicomonas sp. ALD040]|uniref:hypothetical protein n=2 Tax=Endozoicomonas TaxID=305899 RepID=UPI003BAEBAD4
MIIMILMTSEYGLSGCTECSVHENQNIQDMIPETLCKEAIGPSLHNNKRDQNVSAGFLLKALRCRPEFK